MRSFLSGSIWTAFGLSCALVMILSAAFLYLNPQVPSAKSFRDVKLRAPLRIYSSDSKLIQEFGERLQPITFDEIPHLFVRALLDTEDKRFFQHGGIDLITILNASYQLLRNKGSIRTGGSTITMQLVKNISGDKEVKFIRKFKEMLLALKIESELSKQEILALYLNMIPFGKHAFGIQAAANTYYGKNIDQLSLAQMAMLAGVPQAPEAGNPINGPKRAITRRNLVLLRMLEQNTITQEQYQEAISEPITASVHKRVIELPALYAAEMVRKQLLETYGSNAYKEGLVIHTTLDSKMQLAAEQAIQLKLNEYDRRHGYRGPDINIMADTDTRFPASYIATLKKARPVGNQYPAIVIAVREKEIDILTQGGTQLEPYLSRYIAIQTDDVLDDVLDDIVDTDPPYGKLVTISWKGLSWARPYLTVNRRGPKPKSATAILGRGDLVRYQISESGEASLGQAPDLQAALIALDPSDGAIKALVGGYDFGAQQYNHATQAKRQPGSNFKPFFYAGAMENGLTAASIYNDAPLVLPGGELEEVYRPKNSGGFDGNLRLREALYRSKNLISLRVLLDFGAQNAINYVGRFGFDTSNFPRNIQLALGGGTIALSPRDIVTGYATFANGGFKVEPYLISEISSVSKHIVFKEFPLVACIDECDAEVLAERVIEPRVNYIMNTILSDVVRRGTATKARRALKRGDLKGKTGTTNNADIWFSGYTHELVATVWAGFDDNSPVGAREWGSTVPLESWIDFMQVALGPESQSGELPFPNNLVTLKIDPATGKRTTPEDPDGIFEFFRAENAPPMAIKLIRKEDKTDQAIQDIF